MGFAFGRSAVEQALQTALGALAAVVGDSSIAVTADGIVGPATARAANRALSQYVKSAPAALRTGALSVAAVKQNANKIAQLVQAEAVKRRGSKRTAPAPRQPIAAMPRKVVGPIAAPVTKALALALQNSVRQLGAAVNDKALAIKADGIIGPGTVAAVNRALTRHVATAPANMRTGALNLDTVKAAAQTITTLLLGEIARRKAAAAKAPKSQAKAKPTPPKTSRPSKAAVQRLQAALRALGQAVRDKALSAVKVDGIVGPATVNATNLAFAKYATEAPSQLRTGRLTLATVVAALDEITGEIEAETARVQEAQDDSRSAAQATRPVPPPPPRADPVPATPTPDDYADEGPAPAPSAVGPATYAPPPAPSAPASMPESAPEPDYESAPPPAPIPSYTPPPPMPAYAPPAAEGGDGGGAAMTPYTDDGGAAVPAPLPESTTGGGFPWKWVLIGTGGVAVIGVGAYLIFRRKAEKPEKPQRRAARGAR